jgi:chaperone modulatory protein CbpM
MDKVELISIQEFCKHHEIEVTFIQSLRENKLIELTTIRDEPFINADQLYRLEKIVRLYYDLDINLEGIEVINDLLDRIETMQEEISNLRNKLRLFDE